MIIRSKLTIRNLLKLLLLAICLAVSVISILFIYQRQSVIMYVALSAITAALILFWAQIKSLYSAVMKHRKGRVIVRVIIVFAAIVILYAAVISALIIGAMSKKPQEGSTLIVLGCQVKGEQPSLMLSRRIATAHGYILNNPETIAVLSGGQGEGEWISEAEAIYRRLTLNGIDGSKLFLEDRSTSTYENIALSESVINMNGLSRNVAIVTDGFHQYRAQFYAKNMGLNPSAVPSRTPFYVLPYYWLREIAAITEQIVLGINKLSK